MGEHNIYRVPIYLSAKTKEELIVKMVTNNSINGIMFNYFPPIKEGKNWIVWFFADTENYKKVD